MTRNIKEITYTEIQDFINAFKVFRDAAYYEDWTEKMIREEYELLTQKGHVYGYYINGKCVGIVTFRPMRLEDHPPVHYDNPEVVAYLSDITVFQNYRGKGIGTKLMKYALNMIKKEGYERVYMKTLEVGKSMSYNIAVRQGFKLLEGVTSIDRMKRCVKDRKEEDLKIYLDMSL